MIRTFMPMNPAAVACAGCYPLRRRELIYMRRFPAAGLVWRHRAAFRRYGPATFCIRNAKGQAPVRMTSHAINHPSRKKTFAK